MILPTNIKALPDVLSVADKARSVEAKRIEHCFNLLLSTHTALYRSQSPLLLDFEDSINGKNFLNGDKEVIDEAMGLRDSINQFRQFSCVKRFRKSFAYRKEPVDKIRTVFDGEGLSL